MIKKTKQMIKKIFKWIFKSELNKLYSEIQLCKNERINLESERKRIKNLLNNIDVSVDVHEYSPSWAVISIQGKKQDFIKFIELGNADLKEIQKFLKKFERQKIDATPQNSYFLRIKNKKDKLNLI